MDRHINLSEILPLLFIYFFVLSFYFQALLGTFFLVGSLFRMQYSLLFKILSGNLLVGELIQFMFGFSSVI